jgi:hypothetical protein
MKTVTGPVRNRERTTWADSSNGGTSLSVAKGVVFRTSPRPSSLRACHPNWSTYFFAATPIAWLPGAKGRHIPQNPQSPRRRHADREMSFAAPDLPLGSGRRIIGR